jgi:hypothetical protein
MVVARTLHHVAEEKLKTKFRGVYGETVLMGTHQPSSPLSKLRGVPDVLQLIFSFALPNKPNEKQFYYKMGIVMCSGTEHVHVEALENTGNHRFGSLNNQPINGASWFLTKKFLQQHAWDKNPDGSFLEEAVANQDCRPLHMRARTVLVVETKYFTKYTVLAQQ